MSIEKDLEELQKEGVISKTTANDIQCYYKNKSNNSGHRLIAIFGVLGALLVGLGIILIVAHNWDKLPKSIKTTFAFLPLLLGQFLCAYAFYKKPESLLWKESSATFLFLALGACLSLISQIYNVSGNTADFLLTWLLLGSPLIYILNSSMFSLLYLCCTAHFAMVSGYGRPEGTNPNFFWVLFFLDIPFYYLLYKKKPKSNFLIFHHWIICLSLLLMTGTYIKKVEEFIFIGFFSLFSLFYTVGNSMFFNTQKTRNNAYLVLGALGTIVLLLIFSFNWFWKELERNTYTLSELLNAPEFIISVLITLLATAVLLFQKLKHKEIQIKPISFIYILFILYFIIAIYRDMTVVVVLINLTLLGLGIFTINDGVKQNHLGIVNFGLLIITALIICRFFDMNISFALRGILFVVIGFGFFIANYKMLKKNK